MTEVFQRFLEAIAAGDDARTEEAALALADGGEGVLPSLRDLLTDADPDRRWWAVRGLAAVGGPVAEEALIAALEDADPDVRACAVVALADLRPAEAVGPLTAHLSDPSAYVGRLAADALAQFGPVAADALIAALEEGDTAARAGAARALRTIEAEEAIPALYAALDDPSATVTYYAQEALERMGVGLVLFRP
jgi:HEAT repeat protein